MPKKIEIIPPEFEYSDDLLKQLIEYSEKYSVWYYIRFEKHLNQLRNIQPNKYDMIVSTDRYSYNLRYNHLVNLNDLKIDFKLLFNQLLKKMYKRSFQAKNRKSETKIDTISYEDIFKYLIPNKLQDIEMVVNIPKEPQNVLRNKWIRLKRWVGRFTREQKSKIIEMLQRRIIILERSNVFLQNQLKKVKKENFDLKYSVGKVGKRAKPRWRHVKKDQPK